jgi:hypothetical protein
MRMPLTACLVSVLAVSASGQVIFTNISVADAFVRQLDPTHNYGGAGALAVSGGIATNVIGQQQGLLDSFMRFDMSGAASNLNSNLGAGRWTVVRARLYLFEQGMPNNAIFNRGVGLFEVRWIANDSWLEGTGNPNAPTTDGVVWTDKPSLLNSNTDQSLGNFTNGGTDGVVRVTLALASKFVADLTSGGTNSFVITTTTNSPVGFTFHSHTFVDSSQWPFLEITAIGIPQITSLVITGADVKINFKTSSDATNTVEYSNDLVSTNWSILAKLLGTGGNTNVVDTGGAALPRRFYRVRLVLEDQ